MDVPICNKRKRGATRKNLKSLEYQPSDVESDEEEKGIEEEVTLPSKKVCSNAPITSQDIPMTNLDIEQTIIDIPTTSSQITITSSDNKCKKCNIPLKKRKYFYCINKCKQ